MNKTLDFDFNDQDYRIIPDSWQPTEFYSFALEGWGKITLDFNDEKFNDIMKLCSIIVKAFIKLYKETHAFTVPQMYYDMDGVCKIQIGTMENEQYDILCEKKT